MRPDPPGGELQTDPAPVYELRGPTLCRHPGVPPRWQEQRKVATIMPDLSRRLTNLVASHSRDSSPLALLPLWPRLLQLPHSRPSLLLLSPEAGLLCPQLLWPRLLRQ
ncbi:hypothetical protein MRX96_012110 [Rhipicephalus microplus]